MGQAKLRGTYEQRKAAAITRDKAIAEARIKARLEAEAAKTPEQREAERQSRIRAEQWLRRVHRSIYGAILL